MGYELVELGDVIANIATGPFGSNLKVSCFVPKGFPVVDGANLRGYKLTDNITKFVTDEKARSLSRSIAHRGDVVATISGNVGQVAYIPDDSAYAGYLCSQRQFKMSFDTNRVYVPYLVYYLHTREGQHQILSFVNQTGVPALAQPTKNFKRIVVPLPSLKQQMAITRIPELLDDAIELNSRTNGYLAAVCESLAEKQQNTIVPLEGLCQQVNERTDFSEANFDSYISTESLLPEKMGRQAASSLPKSGKVTKYQAGDTLVSNIRPYFKKVWFADCNGTCSGDVIVFRARNASMSPYLYSLIRSDSFFEYVMLGSKGTKMPRGDKKQMMTYPVVASCAQADLQLITFCVHQLTKNARESVMLNELRDSLLPKLMSGEIDVSKVEVPTQPNSHLYEN